MIKPVYFVKPFDPTAAVALIAITSVIGYVFGFLGAVTWNRLHGRESERKKRFAFGKQCRASQL